MRLTNEVGGQFAPAAADGPQVGCMYRDCRGVSLRVVAVVYDGAAKRQVSSIVVEFDDGSARRVDIAEWRRFNAVLQPRSYARRDPG